MPFAPAGVGKLDQSGWDSQPSFAAFIEHTVRQTGALYATMGTAFYCCAQEALRQDSPLPSGAAAAAAAVTVSDSDSPADAVAALLLRPTTTPLVVCTMFTQTLGIDIAEKLGAACAVMKWAPDALPTADRPPFGCPTPLVHRFLPRSSILNKAAHYYQLLNSVMASERAGMGKIVADFRTDVLQLPAMPTGDRLKVLGELPNIYAVGGRSLLPTPNDWPVNATTTGFFFLEEATTSAEVALADDGVDEGLRAWMSAHPRPVVVNFGSMNCMDENVPENAVQAALDLGKDVVFVTGWGSSGPEGKRWDGERVFVCESAPHEWLFPLTAVVVHHGGAGTTARALWSAVPSVIYPVLLFYDQPGWAALLEERRLGVRCVAPQGGGGAGSVGGLRLALERALALPREGSATMAATIRSEKGVERAAALLEGVAAGYASRRDGSGGGRAFGPMSAADGRLDEVALGLGARVSVRWSAADWVAVLAVLAPHV